MFCHVKLYPHCTRHTTAGEPTLELMYTNMAKVTLTLKTPPSWTTPTYRMWNCYLLSYEHTSAKTMSFAPHLLHCIKNNQCFLLYLRHRIFNITRLNVYFAAAIQREKPHCCSHPCNDISSKTSTSGSMAVRAKQVVQVYLLIYVINVSLVTGNMANGTIMVQIYPSIHTSLFLFYLPRLLSALTLALNRG